MGSRFKGQVVIVTGGGRGIGRATALAFAEEGATLVLAGRRLDALRTTAAEVTEEGGKASVVHCDVAKEEDLAALVGKTIRHHKRIDVLVNNAGVVTGGRLDEIDPDDVRRMVDVNIWAPIRLTQLVLPHMRRKERGTVVNVSSLAGRMGVPFYATYCASKYAVRGFSEALRRELADGPVRVTWFAPRSTRTAMNRDAVGALNAELGVAADSPQVVAGALLSLLEKPSPERRLGMPEALFARINQLAPWLVDRALRRQLPQIRRHLAKETPQ